MDGEVDVVSSETTSVASKVLKTLTEEAFAMVKSRGKSKNMSQDDSQNCPQHAHVHEMIMNLKIPNGVGVGARAQEELCKGQLSFT